MSSTKCVINIAATSTQIYTHNKHIYRRERRGRRRMKSRVGLCIDANSLAPRITYTHTHKSTRSTLHSQSESKAIATHTRIHTNTQHRNINKKSKRRVVRFCFCFSVILLLLFSLSFSLAIKSYSVCTYHCSSLSESLYL